MRAACIVLALASATLSQSAEDDRFRLDPDRYLDHVRTLASDDFGGRGNGSRELTKAADYIAAEFKNARLEPGGDAGTYFQAFDISARVDDGVNTLSFVSGGGTVPFRLGAHYYPLSAVEPEAEAAKAPITCALAFAGYGISAPGLGYDDYAGIDVSGKAVVVFTHEPQEQEPSSVFEGGALTPHGDIGQKAELARRRGARLLIVVEDPAHARDRALTQAWTSDPQIGAYGIPVIRVSRSRLARVLGPALDLDRIARSIDATLEPRSRMVTGASVTFPDPLPASRPAGRNVVGVLKGTDPSLAAETIVIGAHYDHLGFGSRAMRDGSSGQIHNGADDNASGTALVIEMAHAAQGARFKRSVIFATFAGEEIGLLGSRHYVQRAPISVRRTVAMLNLDMVGRANGRVMIGGELRLQRMALGLRSSVRLRLDDFRDGYGAGASDNDPFERERVPTLLFFTGFHEDYHQPSDDWERIDARGAAEIGRLALLVMVRLAN